MTWFKFLQNPCRLVFSRHTPCSSCMKSVEETHCRLCLPWGAQVAFGSVSSITAGCASRSRHAMHTWQSICAGMASKAKWLKLGWKRRCRAIFYTICMKKTFLISLTCYFCLTWLQSYFLKEFPVRSELRDPLMITGRLEHDLSVICFVITVCICDLHFFCQLYGRLTLLSITYLIEDAKKESKNTQVFCSQRFKVDLI